MTARGSEPTAPEGGAGAGPASPGRAGVGPVSTGGAGTHPASPGGALGAEAEFRTGEPVHRPAQLTRGGKPSGLHNPSRAMRSLGAIVLAMEALCLLLAILPMRMLQEKITTAQAVAVGVGAVLAILITGLLGRRWGWWLGSGLQVALVACGVLHWLIGAVGVVFGLVWLYVLHVRKQVLL